MEVHCAITADMRNTTTSPDHPATRGHPGGTRHVYSTNPTVPIPLTQLTSEDDVPTGPMGTISDAQCGVVQVDPFANDYIGATTHTNNTGELTALSVALENALRRQQGTGKEEILTDSLYAMNMTTGVYTFATRSTRISVGLRSEAAASTSRARRATALSSAKTEVRISR